MAELLDAAEDVIPAAAVQPGRMIAQFVQDLVHLESGEDRLDQHRRLDGAALDAELVLGMVEDIVPEARLEMVLELRQIEVGTGAVFEELPRIVEKRSEEHTSELQSLMRISYAVFCLK